MAAYTVGKVQASTVCLLHVSIVGREGGRVGGREGGREGQWRKGGLMKGTSEEMTERGMDGARERGEGGSEWRRD